MVKAIQGGQFSSWTIPMKSEDMQKESKSRTISAPVRMEKDKMVPITVRMVHSVASR